MIIKICGVTDPQDAVDAAQLGANWIGIALSRRSKRYVTITQAKEIAKAAREHGAKPIAVFVDENGDEILDTCSQIGVHSIQLHGKESKQYIRFFLPLFEIVFVLGVSSDGTIVQEDVDLVQSVGHGQKTLPPGCYSTIWKGRAVVPSAGRSFTLPSDALGY